MKTVSFSLLLLGLALLPLHAELPPSAYLELQESAPEQLTIQVDDLYTKTTAAEKSAGVEDVTVKATVESVERTETGLKPGDTITILYQHRPLAGGMVGPAPIPVLKQGQTVPAWLAQKNDAAGDPYYEPAARAFSFKALPPPPQPEP